MNTDKQNISEDIEQKRTWIGNCFVTKATKLEILDSIKYWIKTKDKSRHISAVNVGKLVLMQRDKKLAESLLSSAINIADGFPIYASTYLLRHPIPERITGVDLMMDLLKLADENRYRLYFLGARPEVLEMFVSKIREDYPNIIIAGLRDGYFREEEEDSIVKEIADAAPDILFLALGLPQKEYFIVDHLDRFDSTIVMTVGGSFDVYVGLKKRAPKFVQNTGFEWLWRTYYDRSKGIYVFKTFLPFCGILISAIIKNIMSTRVPLIILRPWHCLRSVHRGDLFMKKHENGQNRMRILTGTVPLEGEFEGSSALRSIVSRLLHAAARYLPMHPKWRVSIHRWRGVEIGEGVFIGSEVFIDNTYPNSVVIEDNVIIASGTFIVAHFLVPLHLKNILRPGHPVKEGVRLGRGCYIGPRCVVTDGVTIGECAIIAAGSVVTRDVPDYTFAAGNPARRLDKINPEDIVFPD